MVAGHVVGGVGPHITRAQLLATADAEQVIVDGAAAPAATGKLLAHATTGCVLIS